MCVYVCGCRCEDIGVCVRCVSVYVGIYVCGCRYVYVDVCGCRCMNV